MHYAMPMPVIGAGPHERSATRSNQRNGSRPRTLNTAAGDLELRISKLRADSGISKNELSRVCADLDTEVAAFRNRPVAEQRFPYVYLDATYCKARVARPALQGPRQSPGGIPSGGDRHQGRR